MFVSNILCVTLLVTSSLIYG